MLFSYRLSTDDYARLREIVANELRPDAWRRIHLRSQAARAAFVLYASEWWKRDYDGGPWRWTPVLDSLGIGPVDLGTNDRTTAVELGLYFWGHRPGTDGKRYFGAIVAHGGLPLQVIAKGAGAVSAMLIDGLRRAQRFGWTEFELEQSFAENAHSINQHLREYEIFRLFAAIVTTVLALRSDHNLVGVSNPVEVLDSREPAWRDRFPMSVDDNAAKQLISGLVQEAARVHRSAGAAAILVERYLRQTPEGAFELLSTVQFPRALPTDALAASCGIPATQLPRYFALDVQSGKREQICQGRQLLSDSESTVSLDGKFAFRSGADAAAEHLLIARDSRGDLGEPIALPGGRSLEPDLPWIFALRDARWSAIAAGNCRIPDEEAQIVLPEDARIIPADGGAMPTALGAMIGLPYAAKAYAAKGDVSIEIGGNTYRIRTKQIVDSPAQLAWKGKRLPHSSHPMPIFLGIPRLYRYLESGESRLVAAADLEWISAGGHAQPIENLKAHRGPVEVWWRPNGERQTRFRFVLEDVEAKVTFASGKDELHGSIGFSGFTASHVAVESSLDHDFEVEPGQRLLNLASTGAPPATVAIELLWPSSPRTTKLVLPFPSSGGHFFDSEGRQVPAGARLAVGALAGARLRVFDRDPEHPRSYSVLLELRAPEKQLNGYGLHRSIKLSIDATGIAEVRLIDLESVIVGLLGQSDELDARVTLTLQVGAHSLTNVTVSRYQAILNPAADLYELAQDDFASLTFETVAATRLSALPLLLADQPSVGVEQKQSEGCYIGSWSVDRLDIERAPWLLFPAHDSAIQFRPALYWPKAGDDGTERSTVATLCPLGYAMSESDPGERRVLLDKVCSEMADNMDHPSWAIVANHWRNLSHLPLSVLDSWRAIARNPTACLMCLFNLPEDAAVIARRFRDELGVLWELLSINDLCVAAERLKSKWRESLGGALPERIALEGADEQLKIAGRAVSVLALPTALAAYEAQLSAPQEVLDLQREAQQSRQRILETLWRAGADSMGQQLLMRVHADDDAHWPSFELTTRAIEALQKAVDVDTMKKLSQHASALFRMPQSSNAGGRKIVEHWLDVANMPSICAVWAMSGANVNWWREPHIANALRQIKSFDPLWFEEAYRHALKVCVAIEIWKPRYSSNAPLQSRRRRYVPPTGAAGNAPSD